MLKIGPVRRIGNGFLQSLWVYLFFERRWPFRLSTPDPLVGPHRHTGTVDRQIPSVLAFGGKMKKTRCDVRFDRALATRSSLHPNIGQLCL